MSDAAAFPPPDSRHLAGGRIIPALAYADQPYVVVADDGAWICVLTTGEGPEGDAGQHVVSWRSRDQGKTWSDRVELERPDGPEASYAVLLKAENGRLFCFYNHNTDNVRAVPGEADPRWSEPDGTFRRVDTLGYFVFRFSDDHGRTWSARRIPVPVREFAVDRANVFGGRVRFFWNVGKPFVHAGSAFVPLHKVGGFGCGFMRRTEGVLLTSEDLLTIPDPARANWRTLPDGDAGLRPVPGGGDIAEEQSFAVLSDGSFFVVYRTIAGSPAHAYSRDGGRTWTEPAYLTYANGRRVRHPRAANFVWKCRNGKYLYWFHNHAGRWYDDRNPAWLAAGEEVDSPTGRRLAWSQPEIVLYDDDPHVRMSYPDLIEEDGRYFLTETQKSIARVHEVDPGLLEGLWNQAHREVRVADQPVAEWNAAGPQRGEFDVPELPLFSERGERGAKDFRAGLTFEWVMRLPAADAGEVWLDARGPGGEGWALRSTARRTFELSFSDGQTCHVWECDEGRLRTGVWQHVTVILDGGPKLVLVVIDGALDDGGGRRQFGWGRFSPHLRHINGTRKVEVTSAGRAALREFRIYTRALRVSEAVGNWRATSAAAGRALLSS